MSWRWTGLTGALTVLGAVLFSASPVARADAIAGDCGAGEHVQAAIDQARPGATVVVSGFCDEHVTVREEAARITLDGQGTATIHGPNPALAVITVLGRGITVRGFTLTGGEEGIVVGRGGTALIDGNTIQDTTTIPGSTQGGQGINVAQHSYAVVLNNTIQSNPTQGIVVHE